MHSHQMNLAIVGVLGMLQTTSPGKNQLIVSRDSTVHYAHEVAALLIRKGRFIEEELSGEYNKGSCWCKNASGRGATVSLELTKFHHSNPRVNHRLDWGLGFTYYHTDSSMIRILDKELMGRPTCFVTDSEKLPEIITGGCSVLYRRTLRQAYNFLNEK